MNVIILKNVLFGIIAFCTTMPAAHSGSDTLTPDNGQVSSVIGPDAADKLKCVFVE